jgi:general secretion pathway protein H
VSVVRAALLPRPTALRDAGPAGRPRVATRRRAPGFTLLEILVVVVIIAVMTTLGVLSMGTLGTDRAMDTELERYADAVEAALEQAQLEGRDYGVRFLPGSYEVYAYAPDRQRWEIVPEDRLYERHELPEGVQLRLEIEGKVLQLGAEPPTAPKVPQVVLFASGDVSPYRLLLQREGIDRVVTVDGRPDGTIEIRRPEEGRS